MDEGAACLFCFVPIVIIIINLALALWVYNDAKKRGENEVLWLIVFLVGGIIGLIIWLIVRPDENKIASFGYDFDKNNQSRDYDDSLTGIRCPRCGNKTIVVDEDGSAYCKRCDYASMSWEGQDKADNIQ